MRNNRTCSTCVADRTIPQPKTGYWIVKDGKQLGYDIGGVKTWYIQIMCSNCRFIKVAIEGRTDMYQFCPNCGQPKIKVKSEVKIC